MKSKLAYLVLFSVFGIVAAAAAETAGVTIGSAPFTLPFGTFIISFVLLTLGSDYGRSFQNLTTEDQAVILTPANEVFGSTELIGQRPAIRRQSNVRRPRRVLAHS